MAKVLKNFGLGKPQQSPVIPKNHANPIVQSGNSLESDTFSTNRASTTQGCIYLTQTYFGAGTSMTEDDIGKLPPDECDNNPIVFEQYSDPKDCVTVLPQRSGAEDEYMMPFDAKAKQSQQHLHVVNQTFDRGCQGSRPVDDGAKCQAILEDEALYDPPNDLSPTYYENVATTGSAGLNTSIYQNAEVATGANSMGYEKIRSIHSDLNAELKHNLKVRQNESIQKALEEGYYEAPWQLDQAPPHQEMVDPALPHRPKQVQSSSLDDRPNAEYDSPWDLRGGATQSLRLSQKQESDAVKSAGAVEDLRQSEDYDSPWDLKKSIASRMDSTVVNITPPPQTEADKLRQRHRSGDVHKRPLSMMHGADMRPQTEYDSPWDIRTNKENQNSPKKNSIYPPEEAGTGVGEYDPPWDQKNRGVTSLNHLTQTRIQEHSNSSSRRKHRQLPETFDVSLPLEKQLWYHGHITRLAAESILRDQKECSYLVRNSESSRHDYSLTIKSSRGGFMHMKIVHQDSRYILGQFSKPYASIPEMIFYYSHHRLNIKGAENVHLLYPVNVNLDCML